LPAGANLGQLVDALDVVEVNLLVENAVAGARQGVLKGVQALLLLILFHLVVVSKFMALLSSLFSSLLSSLLYLPFLPFDDVFEFQRALIVLIIVPLIEIFLE